VEPFTEDGSWLEVLDMLVPAVAEWFAPDVIVSQHGCDSHAWDPLTDLRLSTAALAAQARLVHNLAHRVAGGHWLALGGGGYDWARVVSRSWAVLWAEMSGRSLPERMPEAWSARWTEAAVCAGLAPLPEKLLDNPADWTPIPRRAEIETTNRGRAQSLRQLAVPARVRHACPAFRVAASPPTLPALVAELKGQTIESRTTNLETARGHLLLRDVCPASFVDRLHPDPGLAAFTRRPEREHAIVCQLAHSGHGAVAVAHTEAGAIVGQIVLTPGDDWWRGLPGVYELTIETSRDWRRLGIARALLGFTVGAPWIESLTLLAVGLDWHWDLEHSGLAAAEYGNLLRSMFVEVGFQTARTSEPNVALHASNLLLVRIGRDVAPERRAALSEALSIAPWQRQATPAGPHGGR